MPVRFNKKIRIKKPKAFKPKRGASFRGISLKRTRKLI